MAEIITVGLDLGKNVEARMRCLKLFGARVMARDFDRQAAELQVRAAILNRCTALGTPLAQRAGQVCPEEGLLRPSGDLRNKAAQPGSG